MENTLVAKDFIQKFTEWEKNKPMKEYGTLMRNLHMWAEYQYGGRTYDNIGYEYGLTGGNVHAVYKKMTKRIEQFKKYLKEKHEYENKIVRLVHYNDFDNQVAIGPRKVIEKMKTVGDGLCIWEDLPYFGI